MFKSNLVCTLDYVILFLDMTFTIYSLSHSFTVGGAKTIRTSTSAAVHLDPGIRHVDIPPQDVFHRLRTTLAKVHFT